MAIDTVKLRSPYLTKEQASAFERTCMLRQGLELESGEVLYELTTGSLRGSWDSRISVRVMRQDYRKEGRVQVLKRCKPYVLIEGSVHKAMLGHNVYGGPTNFEETIHWFLNVIAEQLECVLPETNDWIVRRVDWAEIYVLPPEAIQQYFRGLHHCSFPRRKVRRYGLESIYCSGTTTTIKMYHKGPEFKKHDYKRIKQINSEEADKLYHLANHRLRVETEILAKKLDTDFGKKPLVGDITTAYLEDAHDKEIMKMIRESSSDISTVRTNEAVSSRLHQVYKPVTARRLFGIWIQMAALGEDLIKTHMPKSSFYRDRKKLSTAGISWNNTDVQISEENTSQLPIDFKPIRTDIRCCNKKIYLPTDNKPSLHF